MASLQVTLYGNANCGLCAQAEALLKRISRELPLELRVVNIDSDVEMQRRYLFEIPVVFANGGEIARAPIYEAALREALAELAEAGSA